FNFPLGGPGSSQTPQLSTTLSRGDEQSYLRSGLNSSWGERNQHSYGISGSHSSGAGDSSSTVNANVQYQSQYAQTSAAYSQGNDYRSQSFSASGGVVAHSGGVTLAQELG